MAGRFTLIIGSMFSSKTSTLINSARKYNITKKVVALIKYRGDDRYSVSDIVSHNRDCISATYSTDDLATLLDEFKNFDVIIIDEIQFFKNALTAIRKLTDMGKIVICAGLNGDFNRRVFPVIAELIPEADEIIHMKSICMICLEERAIFSKLTDRPNFFLP
jgi:thymidine kinase